MDPQGKVGIVGLSKRVTSRAMIRPLRGVAVCLKFPEPSSNGPKP